MTHEVFLDGLEIYGALSVNLMADRALPVYAGLATGEFAVPGAKNLRQWDITCEWTETEDRTISGWRPARTMLRRMEALRGSESARLVIVSADEKISALVTLESYTKADKYSGVYEVTLRCREYLPVSVKTTDVPYIARPGKAPEPPSVVVFGSTMAVAARAQQDMREKAADISFGPKALPFPRYGFPNGAYTFNPNLVPLNTPVSVKQIDYDATPPSVRWGAWAKAGLNIVLNQEGNRFPTASELDKAMRESKKTVYK